MYAWREFVEIGGLISYAPSIIGTYRQAAICARRVAKSTSAPTISAPAGSWAREAKAASISLSELAFRVASRTPFVRAAARGSPTVVSN
jgi:hypothetical protein